MSVAADGGCEGFEGLGGGGDDVPAALGAGGGEAFGDGAAEHLDEGVVVAAGVEYYDGAVEEAEFLPGHYFCHFFECAHASGEGYDCRCHGCHGAFAGVHVFGDYFAREGGVGASGFVHKAGDNACGRAAGFDGGCVYFAHEAHAAASVYYGVSGFYEECGELAGVGEVVGVYFVG